MKTVQLTKKDLVRVLEAMEKVTAYKENVLSARAWKEYQPWFDKFVQQAQDNQFIVNNRKTNTMLWIIDQINHSKTSYKAGTPLDQTDLGREVIEICKNAADGQYSYDHGSHIDQLNRLFEYK